MTRHQDSDNALSLTHSEQESARLAAELCVFAAEAGRDIQGFLALFETRIGTSPCVWVLGLVKSSSSAPLRRFKIPPHRTDQGESRGMKSYLLVARRKFKNVVLM